MMNQVRRAPCAISSRVDGCTVICVTKLHHYSSWTRQRKKALWACDMIVISRAQISDLSSFKADLDNTNASVYRSDCALQQSRILAALATTTPYITFVDDDDDIRVDAVQDFVRSLDAQPGVFAQMYSKHLAQTTSCVEEERLFVDPAPILFRVVPHVRSMWNCVFRSDRAVWSQLLDTDLDNVSYREDEVSWAYLYLIGVRVRYKSQYLIVRDAYAPPETNQRRLCSSAAVKGIDAFIRALDVLIHARHISYAYGKISDAFIWVPRSGQRNSGTVGSM